MKLHGLTPVVSLISSAKSAEALTLLRSSSYGGSVRHTHPRAHARGLLRRRITRNLERGTRNWDSYAAAPFLIRLTARISCRSLLSSRVRLKKEGGKSFVASCWHLLGALPHMPCPR